MSALYNEPILQGKQAIGLIHRVAVAGLPWQMEYVSLVSASFYLQFYALLESLAKNSLINNRRKAIKNTDLYNLFRG